MKYIDLLWTISLEEVCFGANYKGSQPSLISTTILMFNIPRMKPSPLDLGILYKIIMHLKLNL